MATSRPHPYPLRSRATIVGNLCNASPAADSIPALIVHGASCLLAGPLGQRLVAAENFCLAPGQTVAVVLDRSGSQMTLMVTIAER